MQSFFLQGNILERKDPVCTIYVVCCGVAGNWDVQLCTTHATFAFVSFPKLATPNAIVAYTTENLYMTIFLFKLQNTAFF